MLREYYRLTKPGIIRGNLITATGGFLLASEGDIRMERLAAMAAGLALVIASACVFNNYMDRDIDKVMQRTQKRALVTGEVSGRAALIYASVLGVAGTYVLLAYTNTLTTAVALFGLLAYVILYGIGKRRSVHGTLIGSISGATPPVVGYVAVSNQLDAAAVLLFIILVLWQMPHFYAIAIYRAKDYAAAGIPVLPVKRGLQKTKLQILLYILGFNIAVSMLSIFGYTGYTYLAVMTLVGLYWAWLGLEGYRPDIDPSRWATRVFRASLLIVLIFSILISLETWLP